MPVCRVSCVIVCVIRFQVRLEDVYVRVVMSMSTSISMSMSMSMSMSKSMSMSMMFMCNANAIIEYELRRPGLPNATLEGIYICQQGCRFINTL